MKIVVLDGYTLNPGDLSWDHLRQLGEVTIYDRTPYEKIVERSKDATIILTNKTPLEEEVINQLPSLKYIGVLATGYNVINLNVAKKRGIVVTNVPGYGTASVVQLTFALLLELCLHVADHSTSVRKGKWSKSPDFSFWEFPLIELAGKTIGIIGFGSIGERVGVIASAFGMNIIGASRTKKEMSHQANFRWATIPELLEKSDIVSIHCPLTPETKGLINKETLYQMKRTAFLINTSRGPIIIEEDLADALNKGIIAGAGIDVLSVEPPSSNNPLLNARNCLITPHIAWATTEARLRLMKIAVKNLSEYLMGKPINTVT